MKQVRRGVVGVAIARNSHRPEEVKDVERGPDPCQMDADTEQSVWH